MVISLTPHGLRNLVKVPVTDTQWLSDTNFW